MLFRALSVDSSPVMDIFIYELILEGINPMHARSAERKLLKRKLGANINIHMPAPRRIGKTWTISRLADDLRSEGWLVVEVDVQGISDPDKFARTLCKQIQGQLSTSKNFSTALKTRLQKLIDGDWGDNPVNAIGTVDTVEFLEALIRTMNEQESKSAILIDEISYFVLGYSEEDRKAAKDFFFEIRGIQAKHKNIRWLYTGSIGLNIVAERFGLAGAFVDMETFELEPFTKEEARSFLRDPTQQTTFNHRFSASDEDLEHLFGELGWLAPFYLRLVANEIRPSGEAEGGVLTASRSDIETAFEKLLAPNRKSEFAVWPEHIDKNLPKPDQEIARKVLDRTSQSPDGETLDTLLSALAPTAKRPLQNVLHILVNDGLLEKAHDRYRFRSGLIRRYWAGYEAE